MNQRELSTLQSPELMDSLRAGLAEAAAGKVARHEPGYFAELEARFVRDDDN